MALSNWKPKHTIDILQFIAGGLMTFAASRLSITYGPSIGALVWLYPILLMVSVVSQWYKGESKTEVAQLCFDSFGTTIVNAIMGVLLGVLILVMPGSMWWAVIASIVVGLGVGYGYHRLF
jgi:hypothetical protein